MKTFALDQSRIFAEGGIQKFLVHDSPFFKIINFNIKAGQTFPVHSHHVEGQLSIQVIEGSGEFLGENNAALPAKAGDILICDISEPHGARAVTDMRILVTIAPPI